MKRGDSPSGPPPLGRTVSTTAIRLLAGTTGCRRRAVDDPEKDISLEIFLFLKFSLIKGRSNARSGLTFFEECSQIFHLLDLFKCWEL